MLCVSGFLDGREAQMGVDDGVKEVEQAQKKKKKNQGHRHQVCEKQNKPRNQQSRI
jgi:hypothetical protein